MPETYCNDQISILSLSLISPFSVSIVVIIFSLLIYFLFEVKKKTQTCRMINFKKKVKKRRIEYKKYFFKVHTNVLFILAMSLLFPYKSFKSLHFSREN